MTNPIKQEDFEKIFKQHLKIESYSKSIDSLLSPRSLAKTDYSPYYQRNYVWDVKKASYFIESILLGTEVPPLIFFNNNSKIEVIDGRQRFETILRFKDNKFPLSKNGLTTLPQMAKKTYDDLAKKDRVIIETFLDAKIRIIEFALVNEPPLDKLLEDRVKKEIFSRYNTGITPLKKSEVDNAIYDTDLISTKFKELLKNDKRLQKLIYKTFFITKENYEENPPIDKLMQFIRTFLVLPKMSINYYAQSKGRAEILSKLYDHLSDSLEDADFLINNFLNKITIIADAKEYADNNELNTNRLVYECVLWAMSVCEEEDLPTSLFSKILLYEFVEYASANINEFTDVDHHYSKAVMNRFNATATFFEDKFNTNFGIYVTGSPDRSKIIRDLRKLDDTNTKLNELESLRLNKPEPARNSIEDIRRIMQRRRFLVRPSYQRKEVINQTKASSIIESILLGITLPALFIYKRNDGISEVIDGQQRILTILGFTGSEYIDENDQTTFSKNHKFALRKLRIIKELDKFKFEDLTEEQRNKIMDFPLYVVEIEEIKNPDFNPIDLFIRLNDRPYPIAENSFEMWNSWADYDVIQKLKDLTKENYDWFFIRQLRLPEDRDRMSNEELITSLVFLEFYKGKFDPRKLLDVYQKTDRINARIGNKAYISQVLQDVAEKEDIKKEFEEAIKGTKNFIRNLKYVLLDSDKTKDELSGFLRSELDTILKGGKVSKYFRRTMQDFYILWQFLSEINLEMVKFHRLAMKEELKQVYEYIKNIPPEDHENNDGFNNYQKILQEFKEKYKKDSRKLKLTEEQRLKLIKDQDNTCGISGAPIFLGDEIEPDHTIPIAIGGRDTIENLKMAHKDDNRSKGAKSDF